MRIAIVGTGISGLLCAHRLHREHDLTIFEAGPWIGGHTNTVDVELEGHAIAVDTGFIVFNRNNYPIFSALLDELDVPSAPTSMSFSFRDDASGFEYAGNSLAGLIAQKRNLLRPSFIAMLRDIRRFGPIVKRDAATWARDLTLGQYLDRAPFSRAFADHYLLPMAGAIWSAPPTRIRDFPLRALVAFFDNHAMLTPWKAPQWRYVVGGSRRYVRALTEPFRDRIQLNTPVRSIRRSTTGVELTLSNGECRWFEQVVLACHSDQALRLLADPSRAERDILGAIPYQSNEAVLHTDATILPRRRRAWAAWNFHTRTDDPTRVPVTYHMNILQRLPVRTPVNVTLNATGAIDPARILATFHYDHPVYSHAAFDAQTRWSEISAVNRTHYCGAYWGYGFHEDGARSALRVCDHIAARPREALAS